MKLADLPAELQQRLPAVDEALERRYRPVYEKFSDVMPVEEWLTRVPLVAAINDLKAERDAVVMAHNYQTPDIFHGIADATGDSLALARMAADVDAGTIVLCGVHFMAETARLMAPDKKVISPDPMAGCSLASGITAADVRALKARHPGVPVVAYVNTTAEVKAEVDVCCTSGNALDVVNALGAPRVIMVPDGYLARYVAERTSVEIIIWEGRCEVHERFTAEEINQFRDESGTWVMAHPECSPEVIDASDYVGSTAGMIRELKTRRPPRVMLLTECSMADNVREAVPDTRFVQPCNLCPHMKRITLEKTLMALWAGSPEVEVAEDLIAPARRSVQAMFELTAVRAA